MALLAQNGGLNAVPQGTDPYNYLDNILSSMLQQRITQQPTQGQQQSGGDQGSSNPLALALRGLGIQ